MKQFDETKYLPDMYKDQYYPKFLVDKIKILLSDAVTYLETGPHSMEAIQAKFDAVTDAINALEDEFHENGSEIETSARESIADAVFNILKHFNIDLDVEEAIRNRDW